MKLNNYDDIEYEYGSTYATVLKPLSLAIEYSRYFIYFLLFSTFTYFFYQGVQNYGAKIMFYGSIIAIISTAVLSYIGYWIFIWFFIFQQIRFIKKLDKQFKEKENNIETIVDID